MEYTVAYLGPAGTYAHQAAMAYLHALPPGFGCLRPYSTMLKVLSAVKNAEAAAAIVPAENSIEGSVNVTMDVLAREPDLYIRGELVLDIIHHLYSYAGDPARIHTVLGHPQALAQCRGFLERELGRAAVRATDSSAEAIAIICENGDPGTAAIATPYCRELYPAPVLAENTGDYPNNQTRFILVGRQPGPSANTTKTSLVFALEKDRPGGLYKILGEFAQRGINLTKIESRPAKNMLGSYLFFVDCEAGGDHRGLQETLEALAKKTAFIKNLGSYRSLLP